MSFHAKDLAVYAKIFIFSMGILFEWKWTVSSSGTGNVTRKLEEIGLEPGIGINAPSRLA